jgi:hypothetical protein
MANHQNIALTVLYPLAWRSCISGCRIGRKLSFEDSDLMFVFRESLESTADHDLGSVCN